MEEEPARRCCLADRIRQARETNVVDLEPSHRLDEGLLACAEPIELPNRQSIALSDMRERFVQPTLELLNILVDSIVVISSYGYERNSLASFGKVDHLSRSHFGARP